MLLDELKETIINGDKDEIRFCAQGFRGKHNPLRLLKWVN